MRFYRKGYYPFPIKHTWEMVKIKPKIKPKSRHTRSCHHYTSPTHTTATHHHHTPPHTTTHHHTPTHHHTQTTTTTTNGQNQGPSQEYPAERDSAFDGLPAVCVPDDLCMHMRQFMRNQRATKRFKAIHTICTEAPSLSETPNAGRVITRVSITTSIRTPHPKTSVKSDTAQ